jgi:hypothetical protein
MPTRPDEWREGDISLRMRQREADFLREHLVHVRPHGRAELSLLAKLARLDTIPPLDMFDETVLAVAAGDRGALLRARQASCLSGIGRAIYDALVEQVVADQREREMSRHHRDHLVEMIKDYRNHAIDLDLAGLEGDIGALPSRLRDVIEATKRWLVDNSSDPFELFDV